MLNVKFFSFYLACACARVCVCRQMAGTIRFNHRMREKERKGEEEKKTWLAVDREKRSFLRRYSFFLFLCRVLEKNTHEPKNEWLNEGQTDVFDILIENISYRQVKMQSLEMKHSSGQVQCKAVSLLPCVTPTGRRVNHHTWRSWKKITTALPYRSITRVWSRCEKATGLWRSDFRHRCSMHQKIDRFSSFDFSSIRISKHISSRCLCISGNDNISTNATSSSGITCMMYT